MRTDELIRLYPRLFHMAADGSWPSIERHGLLSATALVEKWDVSTADARSSLLDQVRVESTIIEHAAYGSAIVRDQKPIHEESLSEVLIDMTIPEWLAELNSRVFFFVQEERMSTLMNARSYRKDAHTIITIDTASFVAAHELDIELCAINSGFAQRHSKAARGRDTFKSIGEYRHPKRDLPRLSAKWDIAELCIRGGVLDIADHVTRVDRRRGSELLEQLR